MATSCYTSDRLVNFFWESVFRLSVDVIRLLNTNYSILENIVETIDCKK